MSVKKFGLFSGNHNLKSFSLSVLPPLEAITFPVRPFKKFWFSLFFGCEFETRFRRNFFPAYFRPSPLLQHVRKVVGGFGKKVMLVMV